MGGPIPSVIMLPYSTENDKSTTITPPDSIKGDDPLEQGQAKRAEPKHTHGMRNINPISAISHNSSNGPQIASIPTFVSFREHRQWQLEHMACVFRHWSRQNYTFGISGHISVRDPEYHNAFWTNPLGVHFGLLRASDMILLSLDGDVLHPPQTAGKESLPGLREHNSSVRAKTRPANAAGFLIHAALHKRRPDVHAACHAHTPHGRAYSAFAKPLPMVSQDVCKFYKRHSVYESYGGVVLAAEEGELIADALGKTNVGLILRNHGILTVGSTVDEAAWLFDALEAGCRDQLLIDAAEGTAAHQGKSYKRCLIADEEAEYNCQMEGGAEMCYAEFQATYDYEVELSKGDFLN